MGTTTTTCGQRSVLGTLRQRQGGWKRLEMLVMWWITLWPSSPSGYTLGALWECVSKLQVFCFPYKIQQSSSGLQGEEEGWILPMSDSTCVFPWQWSPPLAATSLAAKPTWDVDLVDRPEDASPPVVLVEHYPKTLVPATEDSPPEALAAL